MLQRGRLSPVDGQRQEQKTENSLVRKSHIYAELLIDWQRHKYI
jgi:hypothetical protein